jgi:hypothetical protein
MACFYDRELRDYYLSTSLQSSNFSSLVVGSNFRYDSRTAFLRGAISSETGVGSVGETSGDSCDLLGGRKAKPQIRYQASDFWRDSVELSLMGRMCKDPFPTCPFFGSLGKPSSGKLGRGCRLHIAPHLVIQ